MKFINMENGQILSKGRFETAKIEGMERDTDNKKAMDFVFEYATDETMIPSIGFPAFCIASITKSNTLNVTGMIYLDLETYIMIELEKQEQEALLCYIINLLDD